jgi:hypothetical protein
LELIVERATSGGKVLLDPSAKSIFLRTAGEEVQDFAQPRIYDT